MADYPDDEFDNLESTDRRGAHRRGGGPLSQGAAVALITVLAIVALLLVVGAVRIVGLSSGNPEDQIAQTPGAEDSAPADGDSGDDQSSAPSSDSSQSASDVDKSGVSVGVYNASGKSGAAARYSKALKDDGWEIGKSGNYSYAGNTSVVFYDRDSHKEAAQAIADQMGVSDVKQSSKFSVDIALVLCADIADKTPSASKN